MTTSNSPTLSRARSLRALKLASAQLGIDDRNLYVRRDGAKPEPLRLELTRTGYAKVVPEQRNLPIVRQSEGGPSQPGGWESVSPKEFLGISYAVNNAASAAVGIKASDRFDQNPVVRGIAKAFTAKYSPLRVLTRAIEFIDVPADAAAEEARKEAARSLRARAEAVVQGIPLSPLSGA